MFLLLFGSFVWSALANVRVPIIRDAYSQLRLPAIYNRGNGLDSVEAYPLIWSQPCGMADEWGEYYITVGEGRSRVALDVTDMVSSYGDTLLGPLYFCMGFNAALTRSVESLLYINSAGVDGSLIFSPSNASSYSQFGVISYTNVDRTGYVFGRTMASLALNGSLVGVSYQTNRVIFQINADGPSTVHAVTFVSVIAAVESLGARIQRTGSGLQIDGLSNCYDRLLPTLPTLHYLFTNHDDPSQQATTQIDLYPEDYLIQTESRDGGVACELKIIAETSHYPLIISEHLIRRIGGIHFDYANRRLGVFDPL